MKKDATSITSLAARREVEEEEHERCLVGLQRKPATGRGIALLDLLRARLIHVRVDMHTSAALLVASDADGRIDREDARAFRALHLPSCTTMGMFLPAGTPVRVNSPVVRLYVVVMGSPETLSPHWLH
jgi:hypothetical protein